MGLPRDSLHVLCTLALKGVVEEIAALFHSVSIAAEFAPTKILLHRLSAEKNADLVFLTEAGAKWLEQRVPFAAPPRLVATSSLGLAVRKGGIAPSLGSAEEFISFLSKGPRIAYSRSGASGIFFASLIEALGIRDLVAPRSEIVDDGFVARCLLSGGADYAVQQISELRYVKGIGPIVPFPEEMQERADFVCVIVEGPRSALAEDLVAFFDTPQAAAILRSWGLVPSKVKPDL